jgi:hypothetical protein
MKSTKAPNTKTIFAHLCDQMHKLSAGVVSVEEAKAQSNLAKQANNVLKYELDRATSIVKFGEELDIRNIEE